MSIRPSLPHKTPSRTVYMHRVDRGTSRGRGGDINTGPSESHIVIERGTREESPRCERSVLWACWAGEIAYSFLHIWDVRDHAMSVCSELRPEATPSVTGDLVTSDHLCCHM